VAEKPTWPEVAEGPIVLKKSDPRKSLASTLANGEGHSSSLRKNESEASKNSPREDEISPPAPTKCCLRSGVGLFQHNRPKADVEHAAATRPLLTKLIWASHLATAGREGDAE